MMPAFARSQDRACTLSCLYDTRRVHKDLLGREYELKKTVSFAAFSRKMLGAVIALDKRAISSRASVLRHPVVRDLLLGQ